jgi:hypothetical protein
MIKNFFGMKIYNIFGVFAKLSFALLFIIVVTSCSKKNYATQAQYQFKSVDGLPDYSDLHYWAAHPYKHDLADSVPKPLRKTYVQDSMVDVFFIHPTTLVDTNDKRWNAPIDDAAINAKTDYSAILYQASVFNEQCRVFAPRYRQANLNAFFIAQNKSKAYFDLAYEDVKKAFEYYLAHYNNGRPIIIASHSQGTLHAGQLLKEFFEGKPLQNKLVCAYVIGMPIPTFYFTVLKPCDNPNATNCYLGWRTFKSDYEGPDYIQKEFFKSIVVNPLTWMRDSSFATTAQNKGSILKNFNKINKRGVSAQIHKNILWTSKPKFFGSVFLKSKNYHIADYNLFYMNIRANVRERIGAFWKR